MALTRQAPLPRLPRVVSYYEMYKSNIVEGHISATSRVSNLLDGASFDRFYRVWSFIHAGVIVVLVVLTEIIGTRSVALAILGAWIALALGLLFAVARVVHPDGSGPAIPNLLTTTRVIAASLFLGLLVANELHPAVGDLARSSAGWFLVAGLLIVEATDFFDGRIARRLNAGAFGAIWDMENDVVYAIALTLALRHLHGVAIFVLVIGLMRPLYVLLWRHEAKPVDPPRAYIMFAKTTTAVIVSAMIVAMVPVLPSQARTVVLLVVLTMQLISFGWDLLLQAKAPARE